VTYTGLELWQANQVKTTDNNQGDSATTIMMSLRLPTPPSLWLEWHPWQITLLLEPPRAPIIREIEPLDTADFPRQPQKSIQAHPPSHP